MKFAELNGAKVQATPGAIGYCPLCGTEMIAKCGEIKVHHWSHRKKPSCDTWWENEGPWHRAWKDEFPLDWQEVIHRDASGEKHIADVRTESGWSIELQHSYLNPEERRARNAFYPQLVWVVDGTRRKTDKKQFADAIRDSIRLHPELPVRQLRHPDEVRLLREWRGSTGMVFLDFQENKGEDSMLYLLLPETTTGAVFVAAIPRADFIAMHKTGEFDTWVRHTMLPLAQDLNALAEKRRRQSIGDLAARLTPSRRNNRRSRRL